MSLLIVALCASSIAGEIKDDVIDALTAQMMTNFESLEVADAQEIYHLRYQLISLDMVDAQLDMGAMTRFQTSPINSLGVEVRVGTPEFDNSGFGGWQNGFDSIGFVLENEYLHLIL